MGIKGNDAVISELRSQQHVFCAQDKPREHAVHPSTVNNSTAPAASASGGCVVQSRHAGPPVHAGLGRRHWKRANTEKSKAPAPYPAGLQGMLPSTSETNNHTASWCLFVAQKPMK